MCLGMDRIQVFISVSGQRDCCAGVHIEDPGYVPAQVVS